MKERKETIASQVVAVYYDEAFGENAREARYHAACRAACQAGGHEVANSNWGNRSYSWAPTIGYAFADGSFARIAYGSASERDSEADLNVG